MRLTGSILPGIALCALAQGGLASYVNARTNVKFAQNMRDMGPYGPAGQEQLGGDLRV